MDDTGALLQLFANYLRLVSPLQLPDLAIVGGMVEGSLFQGPDILDQIVREAVRKGDRLYMEDRPVDAIIKVDTEG